MENNVENQIAEVVVNGLRFRNWESVRVEIYADDPHFIATLTVTESNNENKWKNVKIRPSDPAQVFLAGQKVIDGYVLQRQVSYNANFHGILIVVGHKNFDATQCSAPLKTSQMAGYPFSSIAKTLLKPYGIGLNLQNPPAGFERVFKDVNVTPGETVYELLERLARQRGAWISADTDGNYLIGGGDSNAQPIADLTEGKNILEANCIIRDDQIYSQIDVIGQQRGDDDVNGQQSSEPSASAKNPAATRFRNLTIFAEEPGTAKDFADRADTETMMRVGTSLNCMIRVPGWLDSSGKLFWIRNNYTVNSPMLLLYGVKLAAQTVVFEQNNSTGTTTTLTLVRPQALDNHGLVSIDDADSGSDEQTEPNASNASDGEKNNANSEDDLPGAAPVAASPTTDVSEV